MSTKGNVYKVSVLGAGAYGTAIARLLSLHGHQVCLWGHDGNHIQALRKDRENKAFLPGIQFPDGLELSESLKETCEKRDALIFAIPSLYLMDVIRQILSLDDIIESRARIACVTKGFINSKRGIQLVLDAMETYLPGGYKGRIVYLSGPSHAEEMGRDKLTGIISASKEIKNAFWFRDLLAGPTVMVFPSPDIVGVQVSAAVKNVIAMGFGVMDALKENEPLVGDNTESLLFAAGLNEIQTLGMAMGATHPETFSSIAGVGDLDVTCRSEYGRNRRFGMQIVRDRILESFNGIDDLISRINEIGYVPEGIPAAKYAWEMAAKYSLRLPVIQRLFRILNKEIQPLEILDSFRTPRLWAGT